MLTMIGMAMSARRMAALRTFNPIGTPKTLEMSGCITVKPMKPQTTLGIAAKTSMTTFNTSLTLPLQNSETNTAPPSAKGTAISMASNVTQPVPTMRAPIPKRGLPGEFGNQSVVNRNFPRSSFASIGAPSRKTKKRMPKTKMMALMPQRRMKTSMAFSANTS